MDDKDIRIGKMNVLAHIINIHIHNNKNGEISLKEVVDDAEKLITWVLDNRLKYIKTNG